MNPAETSRFESIMEYLDTTLQEHRESISEKSSDFLRRMIERARDDAYWNGYNDKATGGGY